MGVKKAPRETEDNDYAKYLGDKQGVLWYVMVFSGVVNSTAFLNNQRMDKTNINALVKSIECSLHLIYKNQFSIKQQKFKQIRPEFQSFKCISLKNLAI